MTSSIARISFSTAVGMAFCAAIAHPANADPTPPEVETCNPDDSELETGAGESSPDQAGRCGQNSRARELSCLLGGICDDEDMVSEEVADEALEPNGNVSDILKGEASPRPASTSVPPRRGTTAVPLAQQPDQTPEDDVPPTEPPESDNPDD